MAYNQEEQEQLDSIKAWWGQYGTLVILVIAGLLLAIAAFQGWQWYRHDRAVAASSLYAQLEQAREAGEHKKVRDIAREIVDRYGSTPYAAMGALAAARASHATGEVDDAKSQLNWVIERGRQEEVKEVARLRLAGILLDEKRYEDALKTLEAKPAEPFSGVFANLRGDILAAQGKPAEARAAYRNALDKTEPNSQYHSLIQAKLDALGEAK